MEYDGVDKSYLGRGTTMGAPGVAGRDWITGGSAARKLDIPYSQFVTLAKKLGVPKHHHYWRVDAKWLERLRKEVAKSSTR